MLEELDKIDSRGNAEVREEKKEATEKALEGVQRAVGETAEKKLPFISTTALAAEEHLKGFGVGGDVTEEVALAQEPVETPAIVREETIPDPPEQVEAADVTPWRYPLPSTKLSRNPTLHPCVERLPIYIQN